MRHLGQGFGGFGIVKEGIPVEGSRFSLFFEVGFPFKVFSLEFVGFSRLGENLVDVFQSAIGILDEIGFGG